jgi:hypothetical protein
LDREVGKWRGGAHTNFAVSVNDHFCLRNNIWCAIRSTQNPKTPKPQFNSKAILIKQLMESGMIEKYVEQNEINPIKVDIIE